MSNEEQEKVQAQAGSDAAGNSAENKEEKVDIWESLEKAEETAPADLKVEISPEDALKAEVAELKD